MMDAHGICGIDDRNNTGASSAAGCKLPSPYLGLALSVPECRNHLLLMSL